MNTKLIERCSAFAVVLLLSAPLSAQNMQLSISSADYQVTNVFSDVDTFQIDIEFDTPLAAGVYVNPDIISVDYSVSGDLVAGTPSGFPAFALQRSMDGAEFYAQGSSISFEIAVGAVLTDGVQLAELAGNGIVFTFNGKEIDNGRFHPALLELDANGTGQIQNSDNIVSQNPFQQVDFGEEYITDLMFDAGNTTLFLPPPMDPDPPRLRGGGAITPFALLLLLLLGLPRYVGARRANWNA